MAYININTGAVANDGTGDTIRSAFGTVNDNFQTFNEGLFAGTRQSIISAASVTGGYIVSNSSAALKQATFVATKGIWR